MNKKKDKVGEEEAVKNDELPAVDPIPPQIPLEANAEEYKNPASISKARRRLSVDGDEAYLDGVGEIVMDMRRPSTTIPKTMCSLAFLPESPRMVMSRTILTK